MKTKQVHQVIYIDEAGTDRRDDYAYGYCEIGHRFYALKSGKRTERVSWIAALKQKVLFAPMTFQGACNRTYSRLGFSSVCCPI